MRLDHCTWPEVEARLRRHTGILLPVGSTEQHGPTGLLGTDSLTASAVADRVADHVDALVAPVLPFGVAEHHMAFPGTLALTAETFMAAVGDTLRSLARHGFRRVLVVNGHGGNSAALKTVFATLEPALPDLRCQALNWWMGPRAKALRSTLYGAREGFHATPSEIAVTMALVPGRIHVAVLGEPGRAQSYGDAGDYRAKFPDGRMASDPSLATVEDGEKLLMAAVEDVAEAYLAFVAA